MRIKSIRTITLKEIAKFLKYRRDVYREEGCLPVYLTTIYPKSFFENTPFETGENNEE